MSNMDVAGRKPLQTVAALAAALAAGQDGNLDAGRLGERSDGVEVLVGQQLGGRHQRDLAAALDRRGGGQQSHHGLARSDIALEQAQHAFGLAEIGDDIRDGARLRRRERVGQGFDQFLAQASVPGVARPAGRRKCVRTNASASCPASSSS